MKQNTNLPDADLLPHRLISVAFSILLIVNIIVCHFWGSELQMGLAEPERILIRSVLYGIAIILFPLTKLLRVVMLRLNQTMPGNKPAGARYLVTIAVTNALVETVSVFGFIMFILGDNHNTLYIFSLLGALGIYLHKPKLDEYYAIRQALD